LLLFDNLKNICCKDIKKIFYFRQILILQFLKMTEKKVKSHNSSHGISQVTSHRPTSPHLQIYKWNIHSFSSILHRFTGVLLYISIVAICWYIVYYTYNVNISESVENCDCPMRKILDQIFTVAAAAIIFCLYFHLLNGIRHLFWDMGMGFDKETAKNNALLVILLAVVLTLMTIATAFYLKFF
jgi:succinate dehydrogenase / fumarate reductase cytochrome b subunit